MPNGRNEIQVAAHDDQIIVDLDDEEGIQDVLNARSMPWERIEECSRLGLALIRLGDLGNIPARHKDPMAFSELDRLISYLKKSYRKAHGRRIPLIGKNRLVGSVEGSPYTGGGLSGPYIRRGGPSGPYTGGGRSGFYVGGGLSDSYAGGGLSGPSTGGDEGDPQWHASDGGFPKRTKSPSPNRARVRIPDTRLFAHRKRSLSPNRARVGILDTRLFAHPDLADRYVADHDALVPVPTVSTPDSQAHATFIAGVVLARAPNADLIVSQVLNAYNISASSWDVATKMAGFADFGPSVLTISFGAVTHDDEPPLVLLRAVEALRASDVVIVAAAGNHGPSETKMWPAAFEDVVAVGAGARIAGGDNFAVAEFSPRQPWVDLFAPGEGVRSLYKAGGYATWDGTSFSAAAVSGAVAQLVEKLGLNNYREAVDLLLSSPTSPERAAARRELSVSQSIDDIGAVATSAGSRAKEPVGGEGAAPGPSSRA